MKCGLKSKELHALHVLSLTLPKLLLFLIGNPGNECSHRLLLTYEITLAKVISNSFKVFIYGFLMALNLLSAEMLQNSPGILTINWDQMPVGTWVPLFKETRIHGSLHSVLTMLWRLKTEKAGFRSGKNTYTLEMGFRQKKRICIIDNIVEGELCKPAHHEE